jgi:peptide subunit release factor RF-3
MSQIDEWVSAEFQNLAEVLHDYDHHLALEMVPVAEWDNLIDKSKIFRVVDTRKNQVVCYASNVTTPQEVLARVWGMDQAKNDVVAQLDIKNRAAEALELKKKADEMEAARDFALFIIRNKKSRWSHEGRVKDENFNDLGPVRTHIT